MLKIQGYIQRIPNTTPQKWFFFYPWANCCGTTIIQCPIRKTQTPLMTSL
jgi:hypothetical protein